MLFSCILDSNIDFSLNSPLEIQVLRVSSECGMVYQELQNPLEMPSFLLRDGGHLPQMDGIHLAETCFPIDQCLAAAVLGTLLFYDEVLVAS